MDIISIDIDGVLTRPLFYTPIVQKIKNLNRKYFFRHSYNKVEAIIMKILHYSEETIPGSISALQDLHANSYRIMLNSSRPDFLQERTIKWVRKYKLETCVNAIKLRNVQKTPLESKLSYIRDNHIRIHLDDDPYTVEQIAKSPDLDYIFFINPTHKYEQMFQSVPHVICSKSVQDAVHAIIQINEGNKFVPKQHTYNN
jgi:hypothetical protein